MLSGLGLGFAEQLGQMQREHNAQASAARQNVFGTGMQQQLGAALRQSEQSVEQAIIHAADVLKKETKGKKSMVRDYLNRHKDVLFTLVMALLIDHFVLDGALRQRIQRVVEAALERIEKALGLPQPPEKLT